jgi:very-short-patch-repair endonuclease
MTPAERALWEAVRDSRRGVRFRRQQVIGRFIADFYCDAARLVVEIDGDIHDQQADYDAARDRQMTALGLRVLRFRNDQVLTDLSAVLAEIDAAIQSGVSTRTAGEDLTPVPPLPAGEGGGGPAPAGQPPQPGAAPPLPMGEGAGGEVHLPLYEAKLLHQFDHRWATYAGAGARDLTAAEKADPHHAVLPRYWVPAAAVEARLRDRWDRRWLLGWRDICRSTDERTVIASLLPRAGVGHKFPLLLSDADACALSCLYANLNSFVLDYVARQKIGGTSLTYFYLKQFPILPPDTYAQPCPWAPAETLRDWIAARVLELVYTAWDLQPFARDCGYAGPPFRWDETRRFRLRCELDAAYFHLYGIARDGVEDIMDTFPIVRRKDEAAHGEYRTKRVILEVYDAMAAALAGGAPYRTVLDPPPADGWVAHPHPQPLSRPAGER